MENKVCCFTGHRPQKLPWGYDEEDVRCIALKNDLQGKVEKAIDNGYTTFISGMALGCDIWFAEVVLDLKKQYGLIKLEAAIPYEAQAAGFTIDWKEHYYEVLSRCDTKTVLSQKYYHGCLHARNKYMVDQSDLLVAAFNDRLQGGTYSTIKYARKLGIYVDCISV